MKRAKKIEGDQLAIYELLPEAPHQKGIGMHSSRTSLPYPL